MKRLAFLIVTIAALALAALWLVHLNNERQAETARRAVVEETFRVMRDRAENGEIAAQVTIANWLRSGTNTDTDAEAAIVWYRRAAHRGSAEAARLIGAMYETGDGVRVDYNQAADWYRISVNLGGTPETYFALGWLSLYGRGVAHDLGAAVEWFGKAAESGHGVSQYLLGTIYDEGWGVQPDVVKAYAWYTRAVGQRDGIVSFNAKFDPLAARDRLAKRMNSQQVREGEAAARTVRNR